MYSAKTRLFVETELKKGATVLLPDEQSHHLVKVLRQKVGAPLSLFNGDGHDYSAHITKIDKRQTSVLVTTKQLVHCEPPIAIHLGQCLARGERMDFVIQKSVELGVTKITPLFSDFSQVKLNKERLEKRLQHWQKILIRACEQCGRAVLPTLQAPMAVHDWLKIRQESLKLCLHFPVTRTLDQCPKAIQSACLLVGPEGGLSEQETTLAEQHGFDIVQIGPRVLRTETAGIAAVAVVQTLWGDYLGGSI